MFLTDDAKCQAGQQNLQNDTAAWFDSKCAAVKFINQAKWDYRPKEGKPFSQHSCKHIYKARIMARIEG